MLGWLQRLLEAASHREPPPAPVIDDPFARGVDYEYRRPGDPPWVVRLNQLPPPGCERKFAEYVPVAGVSMRHAAVKDFIYGRDRKIVLEREPNNPADPNAVKVIGRWVDAQGQSCQAHLGYLPRYVAKSIAEQIPGEPIGATIEAMFRPRRGRDAGLRIDIWHPSARKHSKRGEGAEHGGGA